eukprot:TRINITY_DN13734_c0_g2_i1.p1 TRINITY_DN13734_c0_g2~~TRINITY_DN13734_c0_g2_i1.p1  ORF type:complete len:108 (+),score=8.33 TRINITY_DN13734_c0_g2_i1:188-511(+)
MTTRRLGLNTGRERSPSPEPVYDKDGKRVNTRDQRARPLHARAAAPAGERDAHVPHVQGCIAALCPAWRNAHTLQPRHTTVWCVVCLFCAVKNGKCKKNPSAVSLNT